MESHHLRQSYERERARPKLCEAQIVLLLEPKLKTWIVPTHTNIIGYWLVECVEVLGVRASQCRVRTRTFYYYLA